MGRRVLVRRRSKLREQRVQDPEVFRRQFLICSPSLSFIVIAVETGRLAQHEIQRLWLSLLQRLPELEHDGELALRNHGLAAVDASGKLLVQMPLDERVVAE